MGSPDPIRLGAERTSPSMRFLRDPAQRRYYIPVVLCLALTALLLLLPTGYEGAVQYQEADRCAARVLAVDDSTIVDTGLVRSGEQRCTLELLGGRFQGRTATGINMLNGSLEQDSCSPPVTRPWWWSATRGTRFSPSP